MGGMGVRVGRSESLKFIKDTRARESMTLDNRPLGRFVLNARLRRSSKETGSRSFVTAKG